ncbi:hypothetical protein BJF89_14935 [Corynebacterium sp. CNJ-954]|uniref:hypothetical protein n=1 Tax=Corynebacterium sp. CNJ-954 TaxID=1904962 RepID=UPI00095AEE9C|nr:hypothetical protein [Corynebacterium sp. CNJ-954]OLT55586.1 hypothetical protein BJF89_14935 [Corynebacterium sp. CNJ-954]
MDVHPLVTMMILPADEWRVLDDLQPWQGHDVAVSFVDGDEYSDLSLYEQWEHEHPDIPCGERRIRTLVARRRDARCSDDWCRRIAVKAVDIIAPHARAEESRLRDGLPVTAAADEIPWSAHTELWSEGTGVKDSPDPQAFAYRVVARVLDRWTVSAAVYGIGEPVVSVNFVGGGVVDFVLRCNGNHVTRTYDAAEMAGYFSLDTGWSAELIAEELLSNFLFE